MAIAFVQKSAELFADNAGVISPSLSGCTAGNTVVLVVANSSGVAATAIAIPSGWTAAIRPIGSNSGGGYQASAAIFYKENISSGTHSATVNLIAGTDYASASIIEFSGLATSGALDTVASSVANSGTSGNSGSATNTLASALAVTVGHPEDGTGATASLSTPPATGYTSIETEPNNATHIAYDSGYKILSSSASQSASWTWTTSSTYANVLAIFNSGGAAPTINTHPYNQRVPAGATATYSVSATTSGGTLTYQWQSFATGAWVDIGGETASTYTTGTLAAGLSYAVRCNVSDSNGTTATNPAALWTPVSKPPAWAGVYGRGGGRDLVRAHGLARLSKDLGSTFVNALFGAGVPSLTGAVLESLTLTDTPAASKITNPSVTEAMALTDAPNSSLNTSGAVSESLTLAESQDSSLGAISGAVTEALTLSEAQSTLFVRSGAVAESMALAESQGVSQNTTGAISESLALVDTVAAIGALDGFVTEALSLGDAQTSSYITTGAVAESMALADSPAANYSTTGAIAESIALADTSTGDTNTIVTGAVIEALSLSDGHDATVTPGVDPFIGVITAHVASLKKRDKRPEDTVVFTEVKQKRRYGRISLADLIGADGAAQIQTGSLDAAILVQRHRKRLREEDDLLLME